ncbi:protein of unknown function [Draconibacterium orientale]|uniref:3-keto-alpha-glucoside-1,2-lyase/3-keto-2-hydroxy-glucal hydratase domain-containing protein n=2 Tax=Draconibacterium orientale TaxID=1168034 RepID=A0A1I0JYF3_9BACT|nr:family 16 glycoside hydrolase [Draconibacterium orientale]SEU15441.1 protein of unknown function [Draconibacterium orientale]
MKTLIISISVMISVAFCSNVSSKNSQVVVEDSYSQTGNDTIFDFDNETEGQLPSGFVADATNKAKSIKWNIVNDNGNKVVEQQAVNSGSCYNLLVLEKIACENFTASVKIKAISGEEDQGGGLVWRYIDKNNYYIARYNPLENNLRFYRVVNGSRKELESTDSDIKQGEWFTLNIVMKGNKITCLMNGKTMIESTDDTFISAGLIGFWTKADAVTYFDDLKIKIE